MKHLVVIFTCLSMPLPSRAAVTTPPTYLQATMRSEEPDDASNDASSPSARALEAIASEEILIRLLDPDRKEAHFLAPDGPPARLAGEGAYRRYRGVRGNGAIYYSPRTISSRAIPIAGAILDYFDHHGASHWFGRFPLRPEESSWGRCKAQGGLRQQVFSTVRARRPSSNPITLEDQQYLTVCADRDRAWPLWATLKKHSNL